MDQRICGSATAAAAMAQIAIETIKGWKRALRTPAFLAAILHSFPIRAHFLRHVKGRPQASQVLVGRFCFSTLLGIGDIWGAYLVSRT